MTSSTAGDELEAAKKLMEWNEERFGEPTMLEYCRYYKNGIIKERHIIAAYETHTNKQIALVLDRLEGQAEPNPTTPAGAPEFVPFTALQQERAKLTQPEERR